jgi:hypothetical protein
MLDPMFTRFGRAVALTVLAMLVVVLAASAEPGQPPSPNAATRQPGDPTVRLRNRTFTPAAGRHETGAVRGQTEGRRSGRVHFLLQFIDPADRAAADAVAQKGGRIVQFVSPGMYIASADAGALAAIAGTAGVRWVGALTADDKLDPAIPGGRIGKWAKRQNGDVGLSIQGHADVPVAALEALVASLGGVVVDRLETLPAVTALFAPKEARRVARQDIVLYVRPVAPPLAATAVDTARPLLGVNAAAAAPYSLDGAGVTALVYDAGVVDQHSDFGGRVIQRDAGPNVYTGNHATHVAGTLGGSGVHSNGATTNDATTVARASAIGDRALPVASMAGFVGLQTVPTLTDFMRSGTRVTVGAGPNAETLVLDSARRITILGNTNDYLIFKAPLTKPHLANQPVTAANAGSPNQWQGIAPKVAIRSFSSTGSAADFYNGAGGDLETDFRAALAQGVDLATMSLANNVYNQTPAPCQQLGEYSPVAALVDGIVRGKLDDNTGAKQPLIFLEAAGNERGGAAPCGQNGTISSPATAKNTIVVGSVNTDDLQVSSFSSLGPTLDGRIKPDLVAPGCSAGSGAIMSPDFLDKAPGNGQRDPGEVQNAYASMCGTSMATPAVAGVASLVLQEWLKTKSRPANHTMKAILVHTAARAATYSAASLPLAGSANDTYVRADTAGSATAGLSIQFSDPGAPNSPILAMKLGSLIAVSLATDASGAVTSTAADVVTAVNAGGFGVTMWLPPRDGDGSANDGSGLVTSTIVVNLTSGTNASAGPTYQDGWGMVDAGAAAELVKKNESTEQIHLESVGATNDEKVYRIYSDGTHEMKVTLAWDDAPASPLGSTAAPALVNDLDLWLVPPGANGATTRNEPFHLDPANPLTAPTYGEDHLNTVEQVIGPRQAGVWEVHVKAKQIALTTPAVPQQFTLIAPPASNSVSVTPAYITEGDSGTTIASFVVALAHADDDPRTITYATSGTGASAGSDFQPASGTLVFAPGEIEKTVPVAVTADIDKEGDETFDLQVTMQGAGTTSATGLGTIVDDDTTRRFTIAGKTGQGTLQGVQPNTVSINDKGDVVFIGRTDPNNPFGSMGIWVGKHNQTAVPVNESWNHSDRRIFDYPTIHNDGSVTAYDRQSGAPPFWFIRNWTAPTFFGGWNQQVLAESGGQFDAVTTPNASVENNHLTFLSIIGSAVFIQWGADGADGTWGNVQAPVPVIADNGATVFRHVSKDASGLTDYVNAPIRVVNVYGSGSGVIACSPNPGACAHPGFTNAGWRPGISRDGSVVAWYGEHAPPAGQAGPPEPGIWASVRGAGGGHSLVKVAGIGDAGITSFSDDDQDERISVNSTQDDLNSTTVVFTATVGSSKAIFRARIAYEGGAAAPTGFHVEGPTLLIRTGQDVDGLGTVDDLSLGDHAVNNRNQGDIAFFAKSGSTEAALVNEAPDVPVLFVPGVGGSRLKDLTHDQQVWFWPTGNYLDRDNFWATHLSLREEDQDGKNIVPTDALRTAVGPFGAIYKPLLDFLKNKGYKEYDLGTDGANLRQCTVAQFQDKPNLFVFPYDWRKSNAVNAAYLRNYMTCVKRYYPDTKVNVLTHSMGGLLTRRTIVAQPGFAKEINSLITVTPPWLGAPKLLYVLRSGDFIPGKASGPGVRHAVEALPGGQQLMPSSAYYQAAGFPPYGEISRDFDRNGISNELYSTFDRMKSVLDKAYPRFKPGTTAGNFHSYAGQDDWSADKFPYDFIEMYGEQTVQKTIGQVFETTRVLCEQSAASTPDTSNADPSMTCTTANPLLLQFTAGDGTVPNFSAVRTPAMQPPGAELIPFVQTGGDEELFSHNGILANQDLLDRLETLLVDHAGVPDPDQTAPLAPNAPAPLAMRAANATIPLLHSSNSSLGAGTPGESEPPPASTQAASTQAASTPAASVAAPPTAAPTEVRSIVVYGATKLVATDDAGHTTAVTLDPAGEPVGDAIPGLDTYTLDDNSMLLRSSTAAPLELTFDSAGPVEVHVTKEDLTGNVSEATRFLDVGLPSGTPVKLTAPTTAQPRFAFDANGDGSYESSAAVDVQLTGTAAADASPPQITVQKTLAGDDKLDVSIAATDSGGSGVRSVRYSTDGHTFLRYTGPIRIDPADDLQLTATAEDGAGNRAATDFVQIGSPVSQRPIADDAAAETNEDVSVDLVLGPVSQFGKTLNYTLKSPATHGTVTIAGATARYLPAADYNGADTFTFTVDNGLLRSAQGTVSLQVKPVNDAPRVTITGPAALDEGMTGDYTATAVDPEGDPVTFTWTAVGASVTGAGSSATLEVGDGPASATISVVAGDGTLNGATSRVITIRNVAPSVYGGASKSGFWGRPLLFMGSVFDGSAADSAAGFASSWSFGDRTPDATTATAAHTYATAGAYTATFRARDKDGATGSVNVPVSIAARTTSLAYTGSRGTVPYGYAELSAKLTDTVDGPSAQLGGRRVTITVGIQPYTAIAAADGTATVVLTSPVSPGTYTVTARFAGDPAYGPSTAASASLKVASSAGIVSGTSLVSTANGARSSFSVSSMDGVTIRGSFDYTVGATTIRATSLAPLGIAPDGKSAWFGGVATTGQQLRLYVEDRGAGPATDLLKVWVNGVLQTGAGTLSAGNVSITPP